MKIICYHYADDVEYDLDFEFTEDTDESDKENFEYLFYNFGFSAIFSEGDIPEQFYNTVFELYGYFTSSSGHPLESPHEVDLDFVIDSMRELRKFTLDDFTKRLEGV